MDRRDAGGDRFGAAFAGISVGAIVVLVVLLGLPVWYWFHWRIECGSGEVAVLIRKTGTELPPGGILAEQPGQKGIQLEMLPEGRHFRNPYVWSWKYGKISDIPAGKLGVQVRLFGDDLPPGKIIAGEGQKGIVENVLRPGKYRINPYAYDVQIFDAINIRPGHVGIVTGLVGDDILNSKLAAEARNTFLVEVGVKGVVPGVYDPGTYYLNPYIYSVVEVNLQSQRFEMSGSDAINFLTEDGFTVIVEGTIEFNIVRDKAALLTHKVGDMEDIVRKIILPRARGFSRIEGSKQPAVDFIGGETRQAFQNSLESHLRATCAEWGVGVNSVLIRNIIPPDAIARVIREREIAVQDAKKFMQQIEQARSQAELVKQQMLAEQNSAKVQVETIKLRAKIEANQKKQVKVVAATRELEVAKIQLQAAEAKAQALTLAAEAERDVIRMANEAAATVLRNKAEAFDGGDGLARYTLWRKLAPQIDSVLTNDGKDGLGGIFGPYLPGKEVAQ